MLTACCKKFKTNSLTYLDLLTTEDHSLQLIIGLLCRLKEDDSIERADIKRLAAFLDRYLNRKIVYEHYFLGRSLKQCTYDKSDLRAEINRLNNRFKTT